MYIVRIILCNVAMISRRSRPSISIHLADRYLTARSHEASKPQNWMLKLTYHSEIWQASWQYCCSGNCQISEWLKKFKPESRGFQTSWDLAVRRPSTKWIKAWSYQELTKDTPYLARTCKLWSVFYEYFQEKLPCYKEIWLYFRINFALISMSYVAIVKVTPCKQLISFVETKHDPTNEQPNFLFMIVFQKLILCLAYWTKWPEFSRQKYSHVSF